MAFAGRYEIFAIKGKNKVSEYFISRLFKFRIFNELYKVNKDLNFSVIFCRFLCVKPMYANVYVCVTMLPQPMTSARIGVTKS